MPINLKSALKYFLINTVVIMLTACDSTDDTPDADTIYFNGNIITLANHSKKVTAIAFKNGRVQAIGSRIGVKRHQGDLTEMIDLDGKTMIPSFIAGNSHFSQLLAEAGDIGQVQTLFASQGITTLADIGINNEALSTLQSHANANKLVLDIIAIPNVTEMEALVEGDEVSFGQYNNRLKVPGFYLALDGTASDYSAWMAYPYQENRTLPEPNWRSEPLMPFSAFQNTFQSVVENELQLFIHAMGDAAIDAIIQAGYDLKLNAGQDQRHVIMMSRFMRNNQLQQYAKLGLVACFDTSNIYQEGEDDIEKLGLSRANGQSPIKQAFEDDLPASNICFPGPTLPDTIFTLWSSVNRVTKDEEIMGSGLRLSPLQALAAMSKQAAFQFFEEDNKGELVPGKQADAIILSDNPMSIAPGLIREIEIIETIKEGKTIYRRPSASSSEAASP
ncbi:amidohydrolase family protein [Photobacterium rosenbergii]|uniref:Amidohydrolase family protein n=1 Tax=Photobacterium rosenbergii TaxID=294936 RepID=A0ABU3ZHR4_9GAMM|nr:amidohydrolase family protein [Photobacterium rosenbergii]MDV5169592.1 amidohydrolase family protein [Photobacterium rosenbergii]